MAQVTTGALDDAEFARFQARGQSSASAPALRVRVPAAAGTALSLGLVVGGAGALFAPDPLPWWARVLAVAAVALGGYLGGGPGGLTPDLGRERDLARERADVIRAALALGVRGGDAVIGLASRLGVGPTSAQPEPAGEPDGEDGRAGLHALPGGAGGETLDPGADDGGTGPG